MGNEVRTFTIDELARALQDTARQLGGPNTPWAHSSRVLHTLVDTLVKARHTTPGTRVAFDTLQSAVTRGDTMGGEFLRDRKTG